MNAIADPSTPEAMIARNAFDRLDEVGKELELPRAVVDLAHQVRLNFEALLFGNVFVFRSGPKGALRRFFSHNFLFLLMI